MSGNTQRENIIAQRIPPMTTLASGRELSDPMPWDMAAGNNPIAAIRAVIITGRILEFTPNFMALYNEADCPLILSRFCLNTVISNTPS
jgi:hypothetical protein